ncbi:TPA: hypothetical protein ACNV1G_004539 [Citrobacter amalonaticus]
MSENAKNNSAASKKKLSSAPQDTEIKTDLVIKTDPASPALIAGNDGRELESPGAGDTTLPDGVMVLEVSAIPEGGFRRAGRFWPHDAVHVFVSDNPDEQVPQNEQGKPLYGCVISTGDAARLKAEKMLIVTELKPADESQGA